MCGIYGTENLDMRNLVRSIEVEKMLRALTHRPDKEGMFIHRNIGLGIRGLNIIDLDTGHPPVVSEDKGVVLVSIGEIYDIPRKCF